MEQNRPAFQLNLLLSVITLILLSLVFFAYSWSEKKVEQSYQQRYQSYLLADELRQSSDDLTRLRTAVHADPGHSQRGAEPAAGLQPHLLGLRRRQRPEPAARQPGAPWPHRPDEGHRLYRRGAGQAQRGQEQLGCPGQHRGGRLQAGATDRRRSGRQPAKGHRHDA